ncbi:MAG: dTMP kinase [Paracoccaceae bacterium]|nr:dTMP kinase [Paracoccaceae bacterium]
MKEKGYFISFEGIDGSGKSTQIQKLARFLETLGFDVIITREPGGSDGGEEIRNLLLQGNVDRWSAETEILLFTAARRDHLERIILPAMENGKIVICDRFTDSTRMYQGMRGPNLRNLVDMLNEKIINCDPDLTIVIDIDPQISLKRAKSRETVEERFEDFGVEMQLNMRNGFIELAKEFSNRIEVVNGQQSVDDLAKDICSIVKAKLS